MSKAHGLTREAATLFRFALMILSAFAGILHAQVPQLINYQCRIAVAGVNFEGTGQFKFALVNADGSTTYWSNETERTVTDLNAGTLKFYRVEIRK